MTWPLTHITIMPPHEEAHNGAFESEDDASSPSAVPEVTDRTPEVTDLTPEVTDLTPEVISKKPDPLSLEEAQGHVATSAGKFERRERWKILKNVVAISFAFMCLFTSFQGISNLQSSINSEGGGCRWFSKSYVCVQLGSDQYLSFLFNTTDIYFYLLLIIILNILTIGHGSSQINATETM